MIFGYALNSITRNYIYVGLTSNLSRRIGDHNKGYNRTTKPYCPVQVILVEEYLTRELARKREIYLKSGVGKECLRTLTIKLPKSSIKSEYPNHSKTNAPS